MANETRILAQNLVNTKYSDLPSKTIQMAKSCILDYLGAAIVGATSEASRIARRIVPEVRNDKSSSIIGETKRTDPGNAALVNGVAGHSLEIDDYLREHSGHIGSTVVPAALALAEAFNRSGKDVIVATVSGYEVAGRVNGSVGPDHYWRGFHTTGTIGTFASVACATKVLDLGLTETLSAIGLAGTQAAGLHGANRTYAKALHAGRASQNGVLAALLAREGYVGPQTILEDNEGFARVTSDSFFPDFLTYNWGKDYIIEENCFKIYFTACFDVADALIQLIQKYDIKPGDVEEIEIGTIKDYARNQRGVNIESINHAKISMEYCAAVTMIDRACGLDQFEAKRIKNEDPEVNDLMKRVSIYLDEEVTRLNSWEGYTLSQRGQFEGGHHGIRVRVRTRSGEKHEIFLKDTRGFYKNPLTVKELEEKFRTICSRYRKSSSVEEIISLIRGLDQENSVTKLMRLVASD